MTVEASQPGNSNFSAATVVDQSFTIASTPLLNQTISSLRLLAEQDVRQPFTVSATSDSGLSVSYSIVAGSAYASISGSTITILGSAPGGAVVTVRASQPGNGTYTAATPVDRSFTINQASQTITFGALPNKTFGDADFGLSATTSSPLAVTYSIVSGGAYASISGNTVHILGATPAGTTVVVRASQTGNANYAVAGTVDQSFAIGQASQTITFGALPNKTFGDADFGLTATASSTMGVTYSIVSGGAYASISGSTIHIIGATPTGTTVIVRASQSSLAATTPPLRPSTNPSRSPKIRRSRSPRCRPRRSAIPTSRSSATSSSSLAVTFTATKRHPSRRTAPCI